VTALLDVRGLTTEVASGGSVVRPVDDVSISVAPGEAVAIVGESGCGKSMTALSILRLLPRGGRIVAGSVSFDGVDLAAIEANQLRSYRGGSIGTIFQDPATFLNPIQRVGDQICEAIVLHATSRANVRQTAVATLARVGIPSPDRLFDYYPHQLSGGMRQRVLIAIAIACKPRLLIADEPTTALDVTTQAQIMELLRELREQLGSALILITHDLGLVAEQCERIYVMYAGRIVEECSTAELFETPRHPYTQALLRSMLSTESRVDVFHTIGGQPPDMRRLPAGCRFAPRCGDFHAACAEHEPHLLTLDGTRKVRCLLYEGAGR
jgi:peptide/nickel transport system ATP-binding protein